MKKIDIIAIGSIILTVIIMSLITSKRTQKTTIISDTITIYDTVVCPVAKDSIICRYETSSFSAKDQRSEDQIIVLHDTVTDSITIQVPISQKTYEDSTYKAVVSGYNASLDSIIVKNKIITNTITKTETKYKNKRLGLGLSTGYDPFNRNLSFTIGLNYNILPIK